MYWVSFKTVCWLSIKFLSLVYFVLFDLSPFHTGVQKPSTPVFFLASSLSSGSNDLPVTPVASVDVRLADRCTLPVVGNQSHLSDPNIGASDGQPDAVRGLAAQGNFCSAQGSKLVGQAGTDPGRVNGELLDVNAVDCKAVVDLQWVDPEQKRTETLGGDIEYM